MAHDAHASHDAHGHQPTDDGPATLPPEPVVRSITPAPEDFATSPPLGAFVWPLLSMVLMGVLLYLHATAVAAHGWPPA